MNEAAAPPKPGLGIWLLGQACELREAIGALAKDVIGDREETNRLREAVERLVAETERLGKVQAIQIIELEQVKLAAAQTQRQLIGFKIGKGIYKAKAQKILQAIENKVN